jgi:hypothetical protein
MIWATLASVSFAAGVSFLVCTIWSAFRDPPRVALAGLAVTASCFALWLAFALLAVAAGEIDQPQLTA